MPQSFWTKTGNSSHSGWFEEGTAKQEQQKTVAVAPLVNSVSEPKTVKAVKNIAQNLPIIQSRIHRHKIQYGY